ncbi:MAG: isoprenylcysteine carboxylmethyltransferase family protein [Candidatus Eremiobacteraeota bacterium]|nr:isoprenylcysteine carboxylmethyltransferase family protein [Candidatus Eremiobacteraeota bacterium]
MSIDRNPTWRDGVFKRRGTLLALPAVALVVLGRPSRQSVAVGVPIAFVGEGLRCWAVGYSGVTTRADYVTAPQLVTAGPYAYIRNPLYAGNLITALGFTIAFTGGLAAMQRAMLCIAGLGTMLSVYACIVPLEESYLRRTFGSKFDVYAARVPRIIPRAWPLQSQVGSYDATVVARAETRTFLTFSAMLAALILKTVRREHG